MCPTLSNKKAVSITLIPSKVFNNNIVGRGTEIPDSLTNISTYITGRNSIIYEHLSNLSGLRNLSSTSTYMIKLKFITNDLTKHANKKNLLKIDKCENADLVDYLPINNNKILSDPNIIMNNMKIHLKSEERNEKFKFDMKKLNNFIKNWDTVKKYVFFTTFYLLTLILCCWYLIYK